MAQGFTLSGRSVSEIKRQHRQQRHTAHPDYERNTTPRHHDNWQAHLARTNAGGLSAITYDAATQTYTLGSGTVRPYFVDPNAKLIQGGFDLTAYNMTSSEVAGDTFVQLKLVAGVWMVDVEDCSS